MHGNGKMYVWATATFWNAEGQRTDTPEETDIFKAIGCPWVEPKERL